MCDEASRSSNIDLSHGKMGRVNLQYRYSVETPWAVCSTNQTGQRVMRLKWQRLVLLLPLLRIVLLFHPPEMQNFIISMILSSQHICSTNKGNSTCWRASTSRICHHNPPENMIECYFTIAQCVLRTVGFPWRCYEITINIPSFLRHNLYFSRGIITNLEFETRENWIFSIFPSTERIGTNICYMV